MIFKFICKDVSDLDSGIHLVNYLIFYTMSLILALGGNPWKKLSRLVQTKMSLGDAQCEKENKNIPAALVLARHRLAIDEAGLEALLCLCLSIGNFSI
jgi:hypothetical protein